ncbi:MAG TPA: serine hydrolase [Thermomonas sp.]|nr:serine hydrolase [Thermomonas sp.]
MKFLAFAIAALLALPATAQTSTPPRQDIQALVERHAQLDLFSGTVIVADDGKTLYAGAHGEANKDHRIPNRLDTSHNIGSIGKTFTAVAIMQLVEAGKLRLDDKLAKFLPDFPFPEKHAITVQQLLNHSSGLGDYMEHEDYKRSMAGIDTIADILPLIQSQKPLFAPGERFGYSNSGMVVLGAIIEKASGLDYAEYLRRHIFEPAGMQHSHLAQEDDVLANRSIGYLPTPAGGYRANVREIMPASADGGLRTTAQDLLRFDQALNGNTLLNVDSRQTMFTTVGPVPFYASGWFTKRVGDHLAVGHGGGAPGINAEFRRYPDDGYTVIVLSNYDMGATPLAEAIEQALFGLPYSLPTRVDADYTRAEQFIEQGHAPAGLAILDRLGAAEQPHLPSLYASARLRIEGKTDVAKALPALTRYIELAGADARPSRAAAWWRKGNAYELLGKRADAKASYEQALALDPDNEDAKAALDTLRKTDGGN